MFTLAAIFFIFYWLPTIVAILRQAHSALGVFVVNLIFGLTGLGWIVALIWALAADNRTVIVHVDRGDYRPQ